MSSSSFSLQKLVNIFKKKKKNLYSEIPSWTFRQPLQSGDSCFYLFWEVNLSNFFDHVPLGFLFSFSGILSFSDIGPSVPLLSILTSIFHHLTSQYIFWRILSSFSSKLSVECFYFWYCLPFPRAFLFSSSSFLMHAVLVSWFQYLPSSLWGQWRLFLLPLSSLLHFFFPP